MACKVIKFLQALTTYASTYVLVALSIDRYDAITHPMNFSNCCKFSIVFLSPKMCFYLQNHFNYDVTLSNNIEIKF